MSHFFKIHSKEIILTVASSFLVVLMCCVFMLVNDYENGLDKQSQDVAQLHSERYGSILNGATSDLIFQAQKLSYGMPKDPTDISLYLSTSITENIAFIRYFNGDREYDSNGFEFNGVESRYILDARNGNTTYCSGFINDEVSLAGGIAIYVPITNNPCSDGLVVFFHGSSFFKDITVDVDSDDVKPEFVGVCSLGGEIVHSMYKTDLPLAKYDNFFDTMRDLTNSKQTIDLLEELAKSRSSYSVSIGSDKYVICFDNISYTPQSLYTVTVYKASTIYKDGFTLINTIYAVFIVLLLAIIVLVIYIVLTRFKKINKITDFELIDPILHCSTQKKFILDTDTILNKNKITSFVLVVTEISHFEYVEDSLGDSGSENVLKYISKLLDKSIRTDETYARTDKSRFALLFHYRDSLDVLKRLKVIIALASRYPVSSNEVYNLQLKTGIYFIDREKNYSVQKMLDCASIAQKSSIQQDGNINIYNDKLHESFLHEAEIEAIMEDSLKNGEFKLFYQPKLNLAQNRIDGSEALVRWFDKKASRFRSPSEFIHLFETNGFIAKLDQYVFTEVCKYFKESIERGLKVVPVSVNISRVTAIQPEFLDYYIKTKKQYGIADGYITLEFTESFAFDNYDYLSNLVTSLRANGFLCSIDDFGSGYSSFEILKALPMDELKLDKFFIQKGISESRDNILLSSIIKIASSLGMKVTQEGVESKDEMEKLKEFGCDVIQGYLYSKPLPMTDYVAFINKNN